MRQSPQHQTTNSLSGISSNLKYLSIQVHMPVLTLSMQSALQGGLASQGAIISNRICRADVRLSELGSTPLHVQSCALAVFWRLAVKWSAIGPFNALQRPLYADTDRRVSSLGNRCSFVVARGGEVHFSPFALAQQASASLLPILPVDGNCVGCDTGGTEPPSPTAAQGLS